MKIMRVSAVLLTGLLFPGCTRNTTEESSPEQVKPKLAWNTFSMGADLSYASQLRDQGVVYKDSGKVKDIFALFRHHGCNTVRIRLWHNPTAFGNDTDQLYNDYAHVEKMIQQSKALGMAVSLDLHYSDTWADPSKQYTPATWSALELKVLKDSVYRYTLGVLNRLKSKDLVPEMIQIGNENNSGMLWPKGKIENNQFASFSSLLNSGIKAVRDFSATSTVKPKIILHVAQFQNADWWVSNVINAGTTDFDVLGISHYADWSTVNEMSAVTASVQQLKSKYKKEVMVVETAYWWNTKDAAGKAITQKALNGYPFTSDGQYQYLKDLTQAVIKGGGTGVHYWAPDYMNSWGGEMTARALMDYQGNINPAIDFMLYEYSF